MTDAARVEVRLGARRVTRAFGTLLANDQVDLAVAPGPSTPSSAGMAQANRR